MSNEDIIDKKEKLLCELLISDIGVFIKCIKICQPEYFSKPLDRVISFVTSHFQEHNNIPSIKMIEAETDVLLEIYEYQPGDNDYAIDEIEKFCQEGAMTLAIMDSVDLLKEGRISDIQSRVKDALMVKIDTSIGLDLVGNPFDRITNYAETVGEMSCGIEAIDEIIGKCRVGELGLLYGISGGGKSLGLQNISVRFAERMMDVSYITIELSEELVAKRMDCMTTLVPIKKHSEMAEEIDVKWKKVAQNFGSIVIKKMPFGTTTNQIRIYLMDYFLQKGKYPDVLIVDYIQIMGVDGVAVGKAGVFELDHIKTAALRELAVEFDMYGFSAGQINRDGYGVLDVNPSHCAGGLSAINNSDWAVAFVASDEDKDNNQFQCVPLKIRNNGNHKPTTLYKCPYTLKITDQPLNITDSSTPQKKETVQKAAEMIDSVKGKEKLKSILNRRK